MVKRKQHSHPFSFSPAHFISLLFGIQQGCVSNENLKIITPKAKDIILKTSKWLPPGVGGAGGWLEQERGSFLNVLCLSRWVSSLI